MTTTAQQAREALGGRLKDLRKDAGITGRALAIMAGWHESKVSKIEHGRQSPSEEDLRVWCLHCKCSDQVPDLIATVRTIEAMYVEWRRVLRAGLKRVQESSIPLYERTSLFRMYEPTLVPGLFQTAEYATGIMNLIIEFRGIPNDVEAAVAARIERQRVLYRGDRRFVAVLEEQALRTYVGDDDTMAGQMDRLMTVMSLPRVSLGVIPSMAKRHVWPAEGFWIFDEDLVNIETKSAELNITQPQEIATYAKVFERLQRSAVYGEQARSLIMRTLNDLRAS